MFSGWGRRHRGGARTANRRGAAEGSDRLFVRQQRCRPLADRHAGRWRRDDLGSLAGSAGRRSPWASANSAQARHPAPGQRLRQRRDGVVPRGPPGRGRWRPRGPDRYLLCRTVRGELFAAGERPGHGDAVRGPVRGRGRVRPQRRGAGSSTGQRLVMMVLIAMLTGISDIAALGAIFGANAAMILFGLPRNGRNDPRTATGCCSGSAAHRRPSRGSSIGVYLFGGTATDTGVRLRIFVSLSVSSTLRGQHGAPIRKLGDGRTASTASRLKHPTQPRGESVLAWQVFGKHARDLNGSRVGVVHDQHQPPLMKSGSENDIGDGPARRPSGATVVDRALPRPAGWDHGWIVKLWLDLLLVLAADRRSAEPHHGPGRRTGFAIDAAGGIAGRCRPASPGPQVRRRRAPSPAPSGPGRCPSASRRARARMRARRRRRYDPGRRVANTRGLDCCSPPRTRGRAAEDLRRASPTRAPVSPGRLHRAATGAVSVIFWSAP